MNTTIERKPDSIIMDVRRLKEEDTEAERAESQKDPAGGEPKDYIIFTDFN